MCPVCLITVYAGFFLPFASDVFNLLDSLIDRFVKDIQVKAADFLNELAKAPFDSV